MMNPVFPISGSCLFEKTGDIRVDSEESPFEALRRLSSAEYECIISDYVMPGMDGFALLNQV